MYGYVAKTSPSGITSIRVECPSCKGVSYVSPDHGANVCKCPHCGKDPIGGK